MLTQLLDAWRINNRANFLLLDKISEAGLRSTLSTRGGRDVARQFAHMHDVRVWWLERRQKEFAKGLQTFASKQSPSRARVKAALKQSERVIAAMLERAWENGGQIKGFKRGVIPALGYFIAHESHHRGSILLTLKQTGHMVDTKTQYGIWEMWANEPRTDGEAQGRGPTEPPLAAASTPRPSARSSRRS